MATAKTWISLGRQSKVSSQRDPARWVRKRQKGPAEARPGKPAILHIGRNSISAPRMGANSAVLASLIITERSALLRRVERLVDDPADAEEVVQSMWLKVQSVDDTRSILSKRAYLFRLARNLALDFRRSQQRRGRLADEVQNILTDSDDAPGQDRIVDSTQMLERVRTAALALPEPTRTIFRLNRFEGESQQAIARRLGISATTVENHIRRALAALAAARDGRYPET